MKKYYLLLVVLMGFGSVSGQIVNIPDANFKTKLLNASPSNSIASTVPPIYNPLTGIWTLPTVFVKVDANNDGDIQVSEAQTIKFLKITGNISDLTGIQAFVNLEYLECKNLNLTTLNLQNLSNLKFLNCFANELTSLNISGLANLKSLNCNMNQLTNLDVTGLINLIDFNCGSNNLTNVNISGLLNLQIYGCQENNITSLIFPPLPNLKYVECWFNQMTYLDVSLLTNLVELTCGLNQLTILDITNNSSLTRLGCGGNQLSTLLLKNNNPNNWNSSNLSLSENPNLTYICADEQDITTIQNVVNTAGYAATCSVSSYCSFNPGGNYYTLQGSNTFDSNNNGCDAADVTLPYVKFNATNGTQSGSFISNQSGQYSIPVQAGTHTVTPVIENPTYFNFSPTTTTVTFPDTTSPFTQNFCITPNGVFQDLDVTMIPMDAAIPGFDATYKIVYRNIGNVSIAMGTVTLDYDDTTLDYVSSTPTSEILPVGNLYYTFLNLQPFETRTIEVRFNLNSPMETPALNSGDLLSFEASVDTSVGEDTNPIDNVIPLQQIVVNSFDPNDKTCLEGTSITPDMIGKYVHYMIRFENTGTFPAENIVVKDMIDATKFDVASLIPLNASHDYTTRITGNKVEFIFENINLPFEDATNDGYIVFKIKTLPTLALGDSFSNSASIYFDYNFPIVTDPAVTTFATLATQDFVFNNYLTVYPNPTNDVLNLTAKQAIELKSMSVYNVVGQLVLSVPNAKGVSTIDVSNLTVGTYFLKVVSDKGTSNVKFMKK